MKKILREIFSGESGRISSKRVFGGLTVIVGLSMGVITAIKSNAVDTTLILGILGTGSALLGVGILEKQKAKQAQSV